MKAKFFLPAFVILFAIGLAFATEESNLMQSGYADTPSGPQPIETDCVDSGEIQCKEGAYLVYKDIDLEIPLYEID